MKKFIRYSIYTVIVLGLAFAVLIDIGCIMSNCISGPDPWTLPDIEGKKKAVDAIDSTMIEEPK